MGNQCKLLSIEDSHSTLKIHKKNSPKKTKMKILEDLQKEIMSKSIFERDIIAKDKYKKFINNPDNMKKDRDTLKKYIDIMELLFYNDTNKDIVGLYLKFLKNNNDFVQKNKFDNYNEEKIKYSKIFSVKEMKYIEENIKTISEKQNLINFLVKMTEVKNYDDFKSYIKNEYENIYYFNYPIEFFEEELFYYKIYILIIKELYKNLNSGKDYFNKRQKVADFVLKNDIFNNKDIIRDEDKMNILIILILYDELDEKNESINFNRLLQTKNITLNELKKFIIDNKVGEIIKVRNSLMIQFDEKKELEKKELEKKKLEKEFDKDIKESDKNLISDKDIKESDKPNLIKINNPNDFCLKNLNKEELNQSDNKYLLFNLNSLLKENDLTFYFDKIRTFLINFINSNVYRQAIIELFPEYNKYILGENLKDMKTFINKRIKFYPYHGLNNSGLTEKFSLYSYIPILFVKINCLKKSLIKSLKISAIIENTIHEINHANQNIIYFKGNDKDLFISPKREKYKGKDGVEHLEEILFGKKIERLRILESLYILNEDNYKQNIKDFKKNFQSLYKDSVEFSRKKKFLKINENAIFYDICIDIDDYSFEEVQKFELYSISNKTRKNNPLDAEIYFSKKVCKMGE